jgi:3-phytase
VVDGETIDGTSETDGIDVTNLAMGDAFPNGFFIAQDGENYTNGKLGTQNFKLVPWEDIANSFEPKLEIDNSHIGF